MSHCAPYTGLARKTGKSPTSAILTCGDGHTGTTRDPMQRRRHALVAYTWGIGEAMTSFLYMRQHGPPIWTGMSPSYGHQSARIRFHGVVLDEWRSPNVISDRTSAPIWPSQHGSSHHLSQTEISSICCEPLIPSARPPREMMLENRPIGWAVHHNLQHP